MILCLGGAYRELLSGGADLKLTARIAGCVLLLMWGGIFIFIIKKNMIQKIFRVYLFINFLGTYVADSDTRKYTC